MEVFFTSDTHFYHSNVIKYCDRPYKDATEMNAQMIMNWNKVVKPGDVVYHLGDFGFADPQALRRIRDQLNGNIIMVLGNHDKNLKQIDNAFHSMHNGILEVTFKVEDEKIPFVLCHYAMRVWNKRQYGAIHLHGHSHGSLPEDANSLSCDVGVDCWDYTPVSMDRILTKMYKKSNVPVDHHGR